jgi:hypothetical protein
MGQYSSVGDSHGELRIRRPIRSHSQSDIGNRRVLFFPYGNHVDYASFYLEHAWEKEPPENWYACVQFALVLWNVNDPSIYVSHGMYLDGPALPSRHPSEPECSRYAPFQRRRRRLGLYKVL